VGQAPGLRRALSPPINSSQIAKILGQCGALYAAIVLTTALAAAEPRYLNPIELAVSPDGARLYVVCDGSDELAVVELQSGKIVKRIPVGRVPKGIALSTDRSTIFVANSWSDTVSAIDAGNLQVTKTYRAGFEPTGVAVAGPVVYTANRIGNDVSVINSTTGEEERRLPAGRGASYLAMPPSGAAIVSTHVYPEIGPYRSVPQSELTVIDPRGSFVSRRQTIVNAAGMFHTAFSKDGRLGITAQIRPKNLIPLAHVEHGFALGNSILVFGDEIGEPVQLLIDELDRYYSMPFGVAIAPNTAYVSTTGADSVTAIDLRKLTTFISGLDRKRAGNDLSAAGHFVSKRIDVGRSPKGVALSPDGSRLYVANRLDDSVSVIDTAANKVERVISLGGPEELTPQRRGERLFYNARFSFQKQFGCAGCHIEGTFDGLAWDLEPDGFGIDIVDNKPIEAVDGTEPFKWNGGNPDLETECGIRTEKFFYRSQSYSTKELADLVQFIKAMPARPNRFRAANGELTPAQERGQAVFERTTRKNGTPIPEELQCGTCHSGPKFTNQVSTSVDTKKPVDRSGLFDTPHLVNIALSAPYLHDGSARTLEEIWTVFNPGDKHGVTNDLSKDELNDLIEYLKTL
jgi:YVTN family beta-propeller protein